MNSEEFWDRAYGLSSLSKKTWKSNHLQISLQMQHLLLSYFKTLSGHPARVQTRNLPYSSLILNELNHLWMVRAIHAQ